ncbi:MAG: hypothetical protein WA996_22560 [Candidatus Promineifilaceae bacterium]
MIINTRVEWANATPEAPNEYKCCSPEKPVWFGGLLAYLELTNFRGERAPVGAPGFRQMLDTV